MEARDLVRSVKAVGSAGAAQGLRVVRAAWRRRRTAAGPSGRGAERARVPGQVRGAEPGPGGGVVRFARSELRVTVAVNGAVFWSWDGAGPEPSYALAGRRPEPDPRAVLEPDTDGGWRVVAERVTVVVSRHGAVEVRTPGGVTLRRDLPPRWWEPAGGGAARWMQRAEVAADARFFGLGGRTAGPRLRAGTYRLGNTAPGHAFVPGDDPLPLGMPVHMVVADAGTHLVFHDTPWDGTVTLREGEEGAGSGHDRAGTAETRMAGGPLRCWVVVGPPARVLHTWAALTGAPVPPPVWALGHHHALPGAVDEREVRRTVAGHREHGLPLDALHLGTGGCGADRMSAGGEECSAALPVLAEELRRGGVRLVAVVPPAVAAQPVLPEGRGGDHREAHDVYAWYVAHDGAEGTRERAPLERPFLLSRTGRAGLQRHGGAWLGEVATGWPGLRASLSSVLGLGLCGVPYSGSDVGGADGRPSPELYLRWLQMGAYLPLFRTRAGSAAGGGELWELGDEVLPHARGALLERRRLLPYFLTLAQLARRTGAPYVRPLWWGSPEDRALRDCEDAFLLGDCLLVAPVLEPAVRRRVVRLPRGRWYDTVTEEPYEGPGRVLVEAPSSRIPVLARAGAVLPVRGADGGLELEVWAPARGRTGGGTVVHDTGDGNGEPAVERYVSRWRKRAVVVERAGDGGPGGPPYPVRIRGLARP
ncbi:TIM-barrel domain-containing protein [Streptomyces sp. CRN 30]|uniref:TIM-barrel domain-containing protein n=1 Tax=Streptomyces sp. CRN 30 TaxID=3075613 RepID=UPI002A840271|nr:TIM-barrel domain-containing protein [Streptomyces sp. CRN 30]